MYEILSESVLTDYGLNRSILIDNAFINVQITSDLLSDRTYSDSSINSYDFDPTITMVNNINLSIPDVIVGMVLLAAYVVISVLALPINLIRDSKPINYQVIRSEESSFAPAVAMGYNFRGNYFYPGGEKAPRMHFLDEGNPKAKHVLVLLHGEPFWSYCWIKIIPLLVKQGFRVIVPDMIGFGKSDKYVDYRVYNTRLHKESLKELLNYLGLHRDLILVGHNWGWMIGAGMSMENPDLFKRFVILNTNNLPDGEINPLRYSDPTILPRFSIINAWFMAFQVSIDLLREWFPLSLMIKALNINYTKKELKAFVSPFTSVSECGGTTAFPLMVPVYPSHPNSKEMREIRQYLIRSNIPTLIAYSDASLLPWISQGDFVVGNRLVFYSNITNSKHRTFRIKDSGHLVMYDQPEQVAQLINNFIL